MVLLAELWIFFCLIKFIYVQIWEMYLMIWKIVSLAIFFSRIEKKKNKKNNKGK